MIPGLPSGQGDEMARAFLAAVFAALRSSCECRPCAILRAATEKLEAGLLPR